MSLSVIDSSAIWTPRRRRRAQVVIGAVEVVQVLVEVEIRVDVIVVVEYVKVTKALGKPKVRGTARGSWLLPTAPSTPCW